jgi:hypothetical protein
MAPLQRLGLVVVAAAAHAWYGEAGEQKCNKADYRFHLGGWCVLRRWWSVHFELLFKKGFFAIIKT